jgi:hypothetical protein
MESMSMFTSKDEIIEVIEWEIEQLNKKLKELKGE